MKVFAEAGQSGRLAIFEGGFFKNKNKIKPRGTDVRYMGNTINLGILGMYKNP